MLGNADSVWFEVKVKANDRLLRGGLSFATGDPVTDGFNCAERANATPNYRGPQQVGATATPDFIFSEARPSAQPTSGEKGYIIGDFKRSTKEAVKLLGDLNGNQAKAIRGYAKKHQAIPLIYLPTLTNNLNQADIAKAGREAMQQGVIAFITAFKEGT